MVDAREGSDCKDEETWTCARREERFPFRLPICDRDTDAAPLAFPAGRLGETNERLLYGSRRRQREGGVKAKAGWQSWMAGRGEVTRPDETDEAKCGGEGPAGGENHTAPASRGGSMCIAGHDLTGNERTVTASSAGMYSYVLLWSPCRFGLVLEGVSSRSCCVSQGWYCCKVPV